MVVTVVLAGTVGVTARELVLVAVWGVCDEFAASVVDSEEGKTDSVDRDVGTGEVVAADVGRELYIARTTTIAAVNTTARAIVSCN